MVRYSDRRNRAAAVGAVCTFCVFYYICGEVVGKQRSHCCTTLNLYSIVFEVWEVGSGGSNPQHGRTYHDRDDGAGGWPRGVPGNLRRGRHGDRAPQLHGEGQYVRSRRRRWFTLPTGSSLGEGAGPVGTGAVASITSCSCRSRLIPRSCASEKVGTCHI